jgi:hypothetical protein
MKEVEENPGIRSGRLILFKLLDLVRGNRRVLRPFHEGRGVQNLFLYYLHRWFGMRGEDDGA